MQVITIGSWPQTLAVSNLNPYIMSPFFYPLSHIPRKGGSPNSLSFPHLQSLSSDSEKILSEQIQTVKMILWSFDEEPLPREKHFFFDSF